MVLTNAFVGALQALSAIQRLSGNNTSAFESVYWNAHSNELHSSISDGILDRLTHAEQAKNALWPKQHVSILTDSNQENLQ